VGTLSQNEALAGMANSQAATSPEEFERRNEDHRQVVKPLTLPPPLAAGPSLSLRERGSALDLSADPINRC